MCFSLGRRTSCSLCKIEHFIFMTLYTCAEELGTLCADFLADEGRDLSKIC